MIKAHFMSQRALFKLPIQFTFKPYFAYKWKIRKNGEFVIAKNCFPVVRTMDPWKLRSDFLSTRDTYDAVLDFMNRELWFHGPFETFKGFCRWQVFVRRALLLPFGQWSRLASEFGALKASLLLGRISVAAKWDGRIPIGEIQVNTPMEAILMTLRIDKIKDIRYEICVRPDCGEIYEITTKHRRLYCSQYCAHLENVRKLRRVKIKTKQRLRTAKRVK
jgi:hypothetical protein